MFTLIIPYHNRASYLQRTLNSLLRCTLKPEKIYLVDNASTDTSAEICRDFARNHPSLPIVLLEEQRPGACVARNKALEQVTTEWVYFFDSDDELDASYFEKVSQLLSTQGPCDLVACATQMVFPDGTVKTRAVQYSDSPMDQILSGQLATQGMFIRTDFLRAAGAWNEHLPKWNDWELGLRLLLKKPRMVWMKDQAFHRIYQHDDSLTGKGFSQTYPAIKQAIGEAARMLADSPELQWALSCRCTILAAHLSHEQDAVHAREMCVYAQSLLCAPKRTFKRIFLKLLYSYVKKGGRGAWYLSKKVIEKTDF